MGQSFRLAGALSALCFTLMAGATVARAQFNPHTEDYSSEAIDQRREQRKEAREGLVQRHEDAYRLTVPLIAPEAIEATRAALARHEAIAAQGGWGVIPEGVTIQFGDLGEAVESLRRRLMFMGDLHEQTGEAPSLFDQAMREAVARYQARNGLRITGFVDQPTRRALNVPAATRADRLRANLARLEKLADKSKDGRYVLVNVPAFMLQAVDNGQIALDSRVVVGKPSRETPEISAKIIELNFLPTLRVPDSIARLDVIPKLRTDPQYLEREHISVLRGGRGKPVDPSQIDWTGPEATKYKFRQAPGPWNALGLIRINMPNKHIVYLHDTPLKDLYAAHTRAFSSGCVRVERVTDLAIWLAQDAKGWDESKIRGALEAANPQNAKLSKPVPVHFVYVTAWATPDGTAHFRPDIYGHDGGGDPGETEKMAGADALSP